MHWCSIVFAMSRLWALVAVPLGAAMALLSAETAGLAVILLIPAIVVIREKAPKRLPVLTVSFGVGFVLGAGYIARGELSESPSAGLLSYAASQVAIGIGMILIGILLRQRSRRLAGI
jgi:hypothetical protein